VENRAAALFRLRLLLALQVRRPAGSEASPLWRSRCGGRKIRINPEHSDFPALLAEALDILTECQADHRAAAGVLSVSATQLVRLLKEDPRALAWLNTRRAGLGLSPLQ
jgi:hypothetical protein